MRLGRNCKWSKKANILLCWIKQKYLCFAETEDIISGQNKDRQHGAAEKGS
jgi:hypothetical protein